MKESKNIFLTKIDKLVGDAMIDSDIHEVLESFSKKISDCFEVTRCGIIFFEENPFVETAMSAYPKTGKEKVPAKINLETFPWLRDTEGPEFPGHLIYTGMGRSHPLKTSLTDIFGIDINEETILIYPIFHWEKIIGAILLLHQKESRAYHREELMILNETALHLQQAVRMLVRFESVNASNIIKNKIDEYLESLTKKGKQKNPNIITKILQSVIKVKRVLMFNRDGTLGNKIYKSKVSEKPPKIVSELYTFDNETFYHMMEESDNGWGAENSVPIMPNNLSTGRLFVDYAQFDNAFKDSISKMLHVVAPDLAQLLYM